MAVDLGQRLLPAFDTATGVPYGTVNLRAGVPPGETLVTSLAGGGTHLLEFAALSRVTGLTEFERVARGALRALWARRSPLELVGNHIDIRTGGWCQQAYYLVPDLRCPLDVLQASGCIRTPASAPTRTVSTNTWLRPLCCPGRRSTWT